MRLAERPRVLALLLVAGLAALLVVLVLGVALGTSAGSSAPAAGPDPRSARAQGAREGAARARRASASELRQVRGELREQTVQSRRWRRIAGGRGDRIRILERRARRR